MPETFKTRNDEMYVGRAKDLKTSRSKSLHISVYDDPSVQDPRARFAPNRVTTFNGALALLICHYLISQMGPSPKRAYLILVPCVTFIVNKYPRVPARGVGESSGPVECTA
jgi:hypothetical protein